MPLHEWDITVTNGASISVETFNPIEGAGSYKFLSPAGSGKHCVLRRNVAGESNKRSGGLQAIMNPVSALHNGEETIRHGVFYLLSAAVSMTGGNPNFYLAGFEPSFGTASIWRYANRHLGEQPTLIANAPAPIIQPGVSWTLRVVWRQDPGEAQGVRTIVSMGTLPDFSDLQVVVDATEFAANGALMGASFGHGFALANQYSGPQAELLIDNITGFNAAPL